MAYIKFMAIIFFAGCTLIGWLMHNDIIAGLFAIALAISLIDIGGTDE